MQREKRSERACQLSGIRESGVIAEGEDVLGAEGPRDRPRGLLDRVRRIQVGPHAEPDCGQRDYAAHCVTDAIIGALVDRDHDSQVRRVRLLAERLRVGGQVDREWRYG